MELPALPLRFWRAATYKGLDFVFIGGACALGLVFGFAGFWPAFLIGGAVVWYLVNDYMNTPTGFALEADRLDIHFPSKVRSIPYTEMREVHLNSPEGAPQEVWLWLKNKSLPLPLIVREMLASPATLNGVLAREIARASLN